MKKCSYCGAEYSDDAVTCAIDLNPLDSSMPPPVTLSTTTDKPVVRRLYSPRQIYVAAFIGSPVAACWCFSRNFRQLGARDTAEHWLIWGCGGSFILVALLCLLPFAQQLPHYIIPIAYSLAFYGVARWVHGDAVTQHVSAGGRLASWWVVIGISLLFLIGEFGLLLVILYPFP